MKGELSALSQLVEEYDYQSYQELVEEIQCIKQSNEYVQEAGKDPAHYLRVQIAEMEARAPRLKRHERLLAQMKKLEQEAGEVAKFYKATCEDLQRMRIRERYLLNQSIDSFGVVTPGGGEDDYQASEGFDFEQIRFAER